MVGGWAYKAGKAQPKEEHEAYKAFLSGGSVPPKAIETPKPPPPPKSPEAEESNIHPRTGEEMVYPGDVKRTQTPSHGYHTTDADNLESILEHGLTPNAPWVGAGKAVYFGDSINQADVDSQHPEEVTLKVHIPRGHNAYDDSEVRQYNHGKSETGHDTTRGGKLDAFYTTKGVPAKHITVLRKGGKEIPLKEFVESRKRGVANSSQETLTANASAELDDLRSRAWRAAEWLGNLKRLVGE